MSYEGRLDNCRCDSCAEVRRLRSLLTAERERADRLAEAVEALAAKWDAIPLPLASDVADDIRSILSATDPGPCGCVCHLGSYGDRETCGGCACLSATDPGAGEGKP